MRTFFQKLELNVAATNTDYETPSIDISSYNGFSVQVVGPAGGAGTMVDLISNNNIDFIQLTSNTITAGKANVNSVNIMYQHLKVRVRVTAGTGIYTVYLSAKTNG